MAAKWFNSLETNSNDCYTKEFFSRFKAGCLRPVAIRICMKRIFDNSIMSLCLSIYCQVTIAPKSTQNILGPFWTLQMFKGFFSDLGNSAIFMGEKL